MGSQVLPRRCKGSRLAALRKEHVDCADRQMAAWHISQQTQQADAPADATYAAKALHHPHQARPTCVLQQDASRCRVVRVRVSWQKVWDVGERHDAPATATHLRAREGPRD